MKECVFINGNRDGYGPDQCGVTLTVRQLCDYLLSNYDEDAEVFLRNDKGYTYGSIREWDVYSGRYDEDEVEVDTEDSVW